MKKILCLLAVLALGFVLPASAEETAGPVTAAELDALRQDTPLERLGTPEDVAALAAFLASPKAQFITGQVLGLNGGFVIT